MKKPFRIVGIIFLVCIVLIATLLIIMPDVLKRVANTQLPNTLNTEASIGNIDLNIFKGFTALDDLQISQPEGFGNGELIKLGHFEAQVKPSEFSKENITVDHITLADIELNIIKDKDGKMNVEAIGPTEEKPEKETAESAPMEGHILVKQVKIENFNFSYSDASLVKEGEAPLTLCITNLNLEVNNLYIGPVAEGETVDPATAIIKAFIAQPQAENAPLGIFAKIGPISPEPGAIPDIIAAVRLIGMELSTVEPVLVPGSAEVLGGKAFDLSVNTRVNTDLLDVVLEIKTDKDKTLDLKIGGTPTDVKVDTSSVLFSVMKRPGAAVAQLAGNVAETGVAVVGTAADTGVTVVKGAGSAVKNFGGGLLKSVKSVAKGDIDGIAEGVTDATVGTIEKATEAVEEAGAGMVEGIEDAGATALGSDDVDAWHAAIAERSSGSFEAALNFVDTEAFPPVAEAGEKEDDKEK